jgi:hypothetical protein
MSVYGTTADMKERAEVLRTQHGYRNPLAFIEFDPVKFARTLAKIAHAAAVWQYGMDGFRPYLIPTILGSGDYLSRLGTYIGGANAQLYAHMPPPSANSLHQLLGSIFREGQTGDVVVLIRLFSHLQPDQLTPIYAVVVGEANPETLAARDDAL